MKGGSLLNSIMVVRPIGETLVRSQQAFFFFVREKNTLLNEG